jgi:hypothetical protein
VSVLLYHHPVPKRAARSMQAHDISVWASCAASSLPLPLPVYSEWAQQMAELLADLGHGAHQPQPQPEAPQGFKLTVNTRQLAAAWESSQRVTKEDWYMGARRGETAAEDLQQAVLFLTHWHSWLLRLQGRVDAQLQCGAAATEPLAITARGLPAGTGASCACLPGMQGTAAMT